MSTCTNPEQCGRPQTGPGHPKKGWIKTHTAGSKTADRWYCSTTCLITDLVGAISRPDVAACAHCANRHDRDHRCPICGSAPQNTGIRTPARRLYDHARQAIEATTREETA